MDEKEENYDYRELYLYVRQQNDAIKRFLVENYLTRRDIALLEVFGVPTNEINQWYESAHSEKEVKNE